MRKKGVRLFYVRTKQKPRRATLSSNNPVWGGDAPVAAASERLPLTANPVQARKGAVRGDKRQRERSAERCALTRRPAL